MNYSRKVAIHFLTQGRFTIFQNGGDNRDRTGNLLRARQALSQLSYIPIQ